MLAVLSLYGILYAFSLLFANVLVATGKTLRLLLIQVAWVATLVPAILVGVNNSGSGGRWLGARCHDQPDRGTRLCSSPRCMRQVSEWSAAPRRSPTGSRGWHRRPGSVACLARIQRTVAELARRRTDRRLTLRSWGRPNCLAASS